MNKVAIKRMFLDPFMPHSHTYHLVHKDGRHEHLCNIEIKEHNKKILALIAEKKDDELKSKSTKELEKMLK